MLGDIQTFIQGIRSVNIILETSFVAPSLTSAATKVGEGEIIIAKSGRMTHSQCIISIEFIVVTIKHKDLSGFKYLLSGTGLILRMRGYLELAFRNAL